MVQHLKNLFFALVGIGVTFSFMCGFAVTGAAAHTGSPTMVTFSAGSRLTSTDLNNALAHIHNTLSAGIVDANISSAAAIAHSKLASPGLVPKASAVVTANCDSNAAIGTDCTFTSIGGVTAVSSQAADGVYCVDLNYTPTNAVFVVQVTSYTATHNCIATDRTTGAACGGDTYNFYVRCYDYTGAATAADLQFGFTVLDDN